MKPIKLIMRAFGPYKDEQIIDFTLLNDNNLFLITGATGSGKTTVFDAVCYALYGEASGEGRSGRGLRSDFAGSDVLTEVEFHFTIKGIAYSIKRMPEQERPNKRGAGMITQTASVVLKTPGALITKIKDADDKIKDILGLGARQFRRIVMIPQGEFRKLLTEESKEREKILKELFNTFIFEKIQIEIKGRAKELYSEGRKLIEIRKSEIEKIECENDTDLYLEINAEYKNIDNIIKYTKAGITEDKKLDKKLKTNILIINKGRDTLIEKKMEADRDNRLLDELKKIKEEKKLHVSEKHKRDSSKSCAAKGEQAKSIEPYEKNYNTAKVRLDTAKGNLGKLKDNIIRGQAELKKLTEEYEKYNSDKHKEYVRNTTKKLNTTQGYITKVEALEKIKKDIELADENLQTISGNIENLTEKISSKEKDVERLKAEYEVAFGAKGEIAEIKIKLNKEQRAKGYFDKLKGRIESRINTDTQIDKQKALVAGLKGDLDKLDRELKTAKLGYHKNQAYLLAKDLKEGEECPVCGSTEHAELAQPYENAVTKKQLDTIEKNYNEAFSQYNDAVGQLAKLRIQLKNVSENINEILKELKEGIDFTFAGYPDDKMIEAVKMELLKGEENIQTFISQRNEKTKLSEGAGEISQNIQKINKELEANNETLKEMGKKQGDEKIKMERLNTQLKGIYDEVPEQVRTIIALEAEIEKLKKIISKAENNRADALGNYTEKDKEISQLKGEEKGLAGEIEQKERVLKDALNEFEKNIAGSIFSDINEYNSAKGHIAKVELYINVVEEYDKKLTEIDTRLNELAKKTEGIKRVDIEKLGKEIEDERAKTEKLNSEQRDIQNRIKNNIGHVKEIESLSKDKEKIDGEYQIVKDLSDAANGDNPLRISLERYVLAAYLDDIIRAANNRLDNMTQGRYVLNRATELEDRRKQSGLELEVLDNYTGKLRNVRTLSGGESFLASLSMALGLSDVVQSYAGGIQLDTMFIDEGFGTLDPETLDGAINTLINLKEAGRLIGIISHVEELKERIDVRLEVKGSVSGSSAGFVGV